MALVGGRARSECALECESVVHFSRQSLQCSELWVAGELWSVCLSVCVGWLSRARARLPQSSLLPEAQQHHARSPPAPSVEQPH